MTRVLTGVAAIVCMGSTAYAQEKDVRTLVAAANQAFADGDYTTALETYRAAELMLPQSPELAYNQGVASYRLGDYARARDAFNRSLSAQDVGLEARIKFNLGNTAYASALQKRSNPPEAIDLVKTAMVHYRDAIELDWADEDARTNIELAQRLLRDLLETLNQQREEGRQLQGEQPEPEQDDHDQQQGGDQPGERQEAGTGQQQQEPPREQADDRMTLQEVERLLQAVRDRDGQRRNELARRRRAGRVPVAKDW